MKQDDINRMIAEMAAARMAKDIDDQVLMDTMGWHEMKLDEGRVYGARYLTVHPGNSWHWNEMMDWMNDTFGPTAHDGVWTPGMRWYANNSKFWFRYEKDRTLFILRWSC